jgi:pantetheine-phosphate adenylyltransferase
MRGRIEVETFDGLTVDFCRKRNATFIVRGLRAISDFENELQMAHTNRKLAPEVDTVFFMTALEHSYLSSSLVKEIAAFGGDVRQMVPEAVARRLSANGRGL